MKGRGEQAYVRVRNINIKKTVGKYNRERYDSEESSVDDFKRKREMLEKDMMEEDGNIFKRINKTMRSPEGRKAENDLRSWLEGLKKKMREGMRRVREEINKRGGGRSEGGETKKRN